ncbi:MAG: glycosyltransferase [Pseudomonadota bacterium]
MTATAPLTDCAAVVIGRNEGERLIACLDSLRAQFSHIVYVDSGSTDGSRAAAAIRGADVIVLDTRASFTAARARNAGFFHLLDYGHALSFVQFLDGDCVLQPNWAQKARSFLLGAPQVAAVCGRRRELYPERSVYNRLIDAEWDTPVGQTKACGGDVMIRVTALQAMGGFNPDLIAGEEPELCVRLRATGWIIWRLDAEMTLHDAALTRFSQWWQRARRAGFAYAEGVAMHGKAPERHNLRRLQRALVWGGLLPVMIPLASVFLTPWALLGIGLWFLQVLRLSIKGMETLQAMFLTLAKFPEAQGAVTYLWRRWRGTNPQLIEYKKPE